MNKKIKVIELLNKIANGEDIPTKIKCKGKDFYFNKYEKSIDYLYRADNNGNGWLVVQDIALTDEVEILEDNTEEIEEKSKVEILEDNTEEIEELDEEWTYIEGQVEKTWSKSELELVNKINELVKAVNKLRKGNKK